MKKILTIALLLLAGMAQVSLAAKRVVPPMIDGRPALLLAGELGNSSAACEEEGRISLKWQSLDFLEKLDNIEFVENLERIEEPKSQIFPPRHPLLRPSHHILRRHIKLPPPPQR